LLNTKKSFNHIFCNYGYLGVKKHLRGDDEGAISCFEEEVRLEKAFDSLSDISISTSPVVCDATFDKAKNNLGTTKIQNRVKHLLTERYSPLEDFRRTSALKKSINSIEN